MSELEQQVIEGEHHRQVWNNTISPIFAEKELELFEAFRAIESSNDTGLKMIKMQLNALEMIRDHFQSKINTGMLASNQLSEENEDGE